MCKNSPMETDKSLRKSNAWPIDFQSHLFSFFIIVWFGLGIVEYWIGKKEQAAQLTYTFAMGPEAGALHTHAVPKNTMWISILYLLLTFSVEDWKEFASPLFIEPFTPFLGEQSQDPSLSPPPPYMLISGEYQVCSSCSPHYRCRYNLSSLTWHGSNIKEALLPPSFPAWPNKSYDNLALRALLEILHVVFARSGPC